MYFPTIKSKLEINFKYSPHQGRLVFGPLEPEAAGLSPLLWATSSHSSPGTKSTVLLAQLGAVSGTGRTWVWILALLLTVVRCWETSKQGSRVTEAALSLCLSPTWRCLEVLTPHASAQETWVMAEVSSAPAHVNWYLHADLRWCFRIPGSLGICA